MCLIGQPLHEYLLISFLRPSYIKQWEGSCGVLDLKRPRRLEILLLDQDSSLVLYGNIFFSFLPNSSPHLTFPHFSQLPLPLFISMSLVSFFILCFHSRVFRYILPSYFLHSSQAFMALVLSPSLCLIPLLSSLSPAAVSTRKAMEL